MKNNTLLYAQIMEFGSVKPFISYVYGTKRDFQLVVKYTHDDAARTLADFDVIELKLKGSATPVITLNSAATAQGQLSISEGNAPKGILNISLLTTSDLASGTDLNMELVLREQTGVDAQSVPIYQDLVVQLSGALRVNRRLF